MTARRQQIAEAVKQARKRKGLTQTELGRRVGAHQQTIGNLERGLVDTSPELLERLEEVLGISLSTAALSAQASADVVRDELARRLTGLTHAEALLLVGEALRFVLDWTPGGDAGEQGRAASGRLYLMNRAA